MSEFGGWCVLGLLWFGGPAGAIVATARLWDDHRAVVWVALAAILAQLAGHVAGALLARDRLPGPRAVEHAVFALAALGGVTGLALGAYALIA